MHNMPLILSLMSHLELCRAIGAKVRKCREHMGLSRRELAKKSGVSIATIGRLETEGTATISVLVKLAISLNTTETLEGVFAVPEFKSIDEFVKGQK